MATVAGVLTLASGCTMHDQDAPPLTGPSEFAQSISITVSPDLLPQDGASQSFITVTALDPNALPIRNLTLRTETRVGGTPVDFGTLSARSVVTGTDGKATLVYTAPASPAVSPDAFLVVDIVVTPVGTDYDNSSRRSASIRLVPQGPVVPPVNLVPSFTLTPTAPADGQTVLFDASASTGLIAVYEWNFGDGARGDGRTDDHAYDAPGTYVVTLTLVDPYGRTASKSQSITVGQSGSQPTAVFVFSPAVNRVGQTVNFNAAQSRPSLGASIVSYTWNFGDGSPVFVTGSATAGKAYAAAGAFTVTLTVTDSLDRKTTSSPLTITITP
jgi:PKD repeat protein